MTISPSGTMVPSGATALAGVVGWPVAHSLSPRLHAHWLHRYAIDGAYLPLPVPPDRLETAVRGLVACGFRGLNVTVPHKQAVAALCDEVDASAARAGAVNTLVFGPRGIIGSNTDGAGFLQGVHATGLDARSGPALILGAGGAARAIAAALLDAGVAVTVSSRTAAAADQLAAALPGLAVLPWPCWKRLAPFTLLVNATTGGMTGQPPLAHDLSAASPELRVADIVYAPRDTPLLRAAQALGLRTVDGTAMLLHQAVPGFTAWFGVVPEVDAALRDAVFLA